MEEAIRDPLPRLKKQLAEEYEDQPEDKIDEVARHALDDLAGRGYGSSFRSSPGDTLARNSDERPEKRVHRPAACQPGWHHDCRVAFAR